MAIEMIECPHCHTRIDECGTRDPETRGTAFFCYAMAWSVNNGVLDRDVFLPVVMKAWEGLVRHVHPDGKLGYVQPVGADPRPATKEMTHEYAMGLFLLAGEQMVRLVESGVIIEEVRREHERKRREPTESRKLPSSDAAEVVEMPIWDRFPRDRVASAQPPVFGSYS